MNGASKSGSHADKRHQYASIEASNDESVEVPLSLCEVDVSDCLFCKVAVQEPKSGFVVTFIQPIVIFYHDFKSRYPALHGNLGIAL